MRSEAKQVCGTASEVRSVHNMAPPADAVTQGPADQRPAAEDAKWGIGSILRMLAIFWLIKTFFGGSSKSTPSNAVRTDYYWPKFNKSESVDFFLFGSDSSRFTDVSDASKLIWTETDVPLAASSDLSTEYLYRPSKVLCLHPGSVAAFSCALACQHSLSVLAGRATQWYILPVCLFGQVRQACGSQGPSL